MINGMFDGLHVREEGVSDSRVNLIPLCPCDDVQQQVQGLADMYGINIAMMHFHVKIQLSFVLVLYNFFCAAGLALCLFWQCVSVYVTPSTCHYRGYHEEKPGGGGGFQVA